MISLNVLGYTVQDADGLVRWLETARPAYTVVMDDLALAARVAATGTTVVFRRYRTDDHRLQDTLEPAAWLDSVADVPAQYVVQAGNEPNGDQAQLTAWTAELMRLATARGRRLAVGNWSVGNPGDEQTADGLYDAILRGLAGTQHLLSVHEYFHDAPLVETYFIGRYRMFYRRAAAIGVARPRVIVTEHGRDLGGGAGDGWRAQGWSETAYADRLDAAQTVYRADGVTACVFGYGRGFDDRWQSFNVEGAATLLARMAAMNTGENPTEEDVYKGPPGWKEVRTKAAGVRVNVRSAASISAPVVTTVATGDWLRPSGTPVRNGSYTWQRVTTNECAVGHVALEVIELV